MSKLKAKRGDTLLEVVFAFVMFSLVTVIAISAMSSGISKAEASLELTLARLEIDSQSETLRFIQGAFANDRAYTNLWRKITDRALKRTAAGEAPDTPDLSVSACSKIYGDYAELNAKSLYDYNSFVVNPRKIGDNLDETQPDYYGYTLITANDRTNDPVPFLASSLYPRLIYTDKSVDEDGNLQTSDDTLQEETLLPYVSAVEGIYDFAVQDLDHSNNPNYYDFYIYTCWYAPGAERPTTIGTVMRLYNPEFTNQ